MDACGWDPSTWGGCLNNDWQGTVNWWNGLSPTEQGIIIGVAVVAVVAVAVLTIQPELLAPVAGFLGIGGSTAASVACDEGACEELVDQAIADFSSQSIDDAVARVTTTRGGDLPNLIGNSRVAQTVFQLIASGTNPGDISVEEPFVLSNGQIVRPDIAVYQDGELIQFIEVKGGYVSGTRAIDQALNYAQLSVEQGVPTFYRLYNGGSQAFLRFLAQEVHIPTM